jgi:DNA (cytosine-5)-methyltransferase 1
MVGLFAGVGAMELGLEKHGHTATLLAEIDPVAQAILKRRFQAAEVVGDVRSIRTLPACDLVSAGFPCQDLSQCGKTAGIEGKNSSLVREVFRLVETAKTQPDWLLLENVPFMLRLDQGRAMTLIVSELERLGYCWAYRTVDARAFGIPQRRRRVILVASRGQRDEPNQVLFADSQTEPNDPTAADAYGFYWTEGNNGIGWGVDCVPTLKGGSKFGIPSPPAIWIPHERAIVTIDIRDAERLQGLPIGWTRPAAGMEARIGERWRLVGNAVCVPAAAWVGRRLARPGKGQLNRGNAISKNGPWPPAACGDSKGVWEVKASSWPIARKWHRILDFLRFPTLPLSARATAGFLSRVKKGRLRLAQGFLADLAHHFATVSEPQAI